jgi:flagellar assembly protein FliH
MATIIKPESLQRASGTALRGVAYNLTDMAAQATDYQRSVQQDAAQIVEAARRDADTVRREAETAGRRAAEAAIDRILDEKVAQQMKTLTPALRAAVQHIADAKQEWLRHWEHAAVDLAIAIAERLTRGELTRRPEIALDWIRQSLELAAGSGEVVIHLHPGDHAAIERSVEQLAAAVCPLATARVVADGAVSAGGCRIATEFGTIDGRLEAQLERIREELR